MSKLSEVAVVAAVTAAVSIFGTALVQNWPEAIPVTAKAYTTDFPRAERSGDACAQEVECTPQQVYANVLQGLRYPSGGSIIDLRIRNRSSTRVSGLQFRAPYADVAVFCAGRVLCDNARAFTPDEEGVLRLGDVEPGHEIRALVVLSQPVIDERAYSLALLDGRGVTIDYLNDEDYTSLGILGIVRRNVPGSEFVVVMTILFSVIFVVGAIASGLTSNNFPLLLKLHSVADLRRAVRFGDFVRQQRPDIISVESEAKADRNEGT